MSKLIIEIKESEYLIKLQKGAFDLSQVRTMLNQLMQLSHPEAETEFVGFSNRRSSELLERFDHLSDK